MAHKVRDIDQPRSHGQMHMERKLHHQSDAHQRLAKLESKLTLRLTHQMFANISLSETPIDKDCLEDLSGATATATALG